MEDRHDLEGLFRKVQNQERSNRPESQRGKRQIFARVSESWTACQKAKSLDESYHHPASGLRAVLADVILNLAKVAFHVAAKEESLHSPSNRAMTSSPSTLSPRFKESKRSRTA